MSKQDKDRFQKELAMRYCLARGIVPFLEVIVHSGSSLSDSEEVLTDIDVLGVESIGDGGLRRTIFDCKTANRMSAVNRAFWAAGIKEFGGCDEAYVILKGKAVHNHRIAALSMNVDLHDEKSFEDLGQTIDPSFPTDSCYQASIARWTALNDCYTRNSWSDVLFKITRSVAPLTKTPWSIFRRTIAELRAVHGQLDPGKREHLAIFFDVLASTFLLWTTLSRDIRRFYEPTMEKKDFETILRYYLWGGRESYQIRQQMREKTNPNSNDATVELPCWPSLVSFAGVVIGAPQNIFGCVHACKELSLRLASETNERFDESLKRNIEENKRIRPFTMALGEYLISAGRLPKDFNAELKSIVLSC